MTVLVEQAYFKLLRAKQSLQWHLN